MARASWIPIPSSSDFTLANLPFGIISTKASPNPRPAVAVGDQALDLAAFAGGKGFSTLSSITSHLDVFQKPTLNAFAALGRQVHREVRAYLQDILAEDTSHGTALRDNEELRQACLVPLKDVTMHLPMGIGDYTDFYAGKNHAYNIGVLFRGPANALQPNYTHLPVGYHGRASSVVVSGTPVRRPWGQLLVAETKQPEWAPCRRLDIELELGAFICSNNPLGNGVRMADAEQHIFGYVLMNDWSARDIQSWEYVPLGPFNSKNFATTISPWVVLADALEPFKTEGLPNDHDVLPYLKPVNDKDFLDIHLEIEIQTPQSQTPTKVTETSASNLLWSFPQMIAHHTVGGCPMRTGDLLGSGTISGVETGSQGSFLELTDGGKKEVTLASGEKMKFLRDNDTVTIRGWCGSDGQRVGFGSCVGQILPAWKNGYPE